MEDWSREAAHMGGYYSNSLLTISAVSASDANQGLFVDRDPCVLSPSPIDLRFPQSSEGHIPEVQTVSGFTHPASDWDPARETSQYRRHRPPLWQRGWVVQERLLSPRLLMF